MALFKVLRLYPDPGGPTELAPSTVPENQVDTTVTDEAAAIAFIDSKVNYTSPSNPALWRIGPTGRVLGYRGNCDRTQFWSYYEVTS